MGAGEGSGGDGGSAIWSLIWLLLLIFLGIWLAGFCAFWYIIFNIFAACIEALNPICELLLKGVQLTGSMARYMVQGTPINEAFK